MTSTYNYIESLNPKMNPFGTFASSDTDPGYLSRIRIFPIPDPLSASKNLSILIQKLFLRSRKSSWIPDALRYLATVLFLPWQAFQIHQHLLAGKSSPSRRNNRFGSSWKKKKKKLLAVWLMTNELYPGIILCLNNGSINAMIRYEDG